MRPARQEFPPDIHADTTSLGIGASGVHTQSRDFTGAINANAVINTGMGFEYLLKPGPRDPRRCCE